MAEPWRFYGRQKELAELRSFMDSAPRFAMLAVRGRRKVGKTELVRHFFAQQQADPARPVVMLNLEVPGASVRFYSALRREIRRTDPRLLDGFEPEENDPVGNFALLIEHLLDRGATVVLDEFQRIAPTPGEDPSLHLPGMFQRILDEQNGLSRPPGKGERPRLIVMGSEQQKLLALFQEGQELFAQPRTEIVVRPWTFPELAEAVADRGWDTRPDRLLTLWTAWGGMPAHWRRFADETPELADFGREMEEGAWTDAFLAAEERHRQTRDGGFARQMEIQLRPADRALLSWLAARPGGRDLNELWKRDAGPAARQVMAGLEQEFRQQPEVVTAVTGCEETAARREGREADPVQAVERAAVREALDRRLSGEHLGLVGGRNAVDDPRAERWHVSDEHARFQLDVLEPVAASARPAEDEALPEEETAALRAGRMRNAEGRGLETLARAMLEDRFDPGRTGSPVRLGAWRRKPDAEIDLYAVSRDAFWPAFAKRNPDGHDPARDSRHVADWLRPLTSPHLRDMDARLARWRTTERNLLFVSPSFDAQTLEALGARVDQAVLDSPDARDVAGWYAIDIPAMLDGAAPVPLRVPEPAPPEEDGKDNDGGDGSGGSMSDGP